MIYFEFLSLHYALCLMSLSETFQNLLISDTPVLRENLSSPTSSHSLDNKGNAAYNHNASPLPHHSSDCFSYSHNDKPTSSLTFFYNNARSILPKMHFLSNYVAIHNPTVIALTETWLNKHEPSSLVTPINYVCYRKDRLESRGGGCLILVDKRFSSGHVDIYPQEVPQQNRIDAVACRLSLTPCCELGLLCIYRPPNSDSCDYDMMLDILDRFLNLNFKLNIIMGDFNFPDICWPFGANSSASRTFLNFCHEKLLTQHVLVPTRRASNAVLDLIFSTYGTEVSNVAVDEEMSSSDHSIINFTVPIKHISNNRKKIRRRNIKKANWSHFQELLIPMPGWNDILASKDVDLIWNYFLNLLTSALDVVAPYRYLSPRRLCSSKVRTALRLKRRQYRALVNDPSNINRLLYKRSSILANKVITEDLNEIENQIINSADARMFWSFVNKRINMHYDIQHISYDDNNIFDKKQIANLFNQHFISIFSDLPSGSPVNPVTRILPKPTQHSNSSLLPITCDDVMKLLKKLPNKSSTDGDGISYVILKNGGSSVAFYLAKLFSVSLETCRLPTAWKTAIVSPIFKSGTRTSIANYRPISVTSCCCRVLERHIKNILSDFFQRRGTLLDSQHGFLKGRSTDTLLLKFYDYVTSNIDANRIVDAVFFDFSKAFDKIPHDRLLSKLAAYDIDYSLLLWIRDFLFNRSQRVKIGDVLSDPLLVTSGVIQ